jgi:hypothetical protein
MGSAPPARVETVAAAAALTGCTPDGPTEQEDGLCYLFVTVATDTCTDATLEQALADAG